jgi:hypothetical protein
MKITYVDDNGNVKHEEVKQLNTYNVKYLETQYDESNGEFYEVNGGEYTETLSDGENEQNAIENLAKMWEDKEFYSRRYHCEQDAINFNFYKVFGLSFVLDITVKGKLKEKINFELV